VAQDRNRWYTVGSLVTDLGFHKIQGIS